MYCPGHHLPRGRNPGAENTWVEPQTPNLRHLVFFGLKRAQIVHFAPLKMANLRGTWIFAVRPLIFQDSGEQREFLALQPPVDVRFSACAFQALLSQGKMPVQLFFYTQCCLFSTFRTITRKIQSRKLWESIFCRLKKFSGYKVRDCMELGKKVAARRAQKKIQRLFGSGHQEFDAVNGSGLVNKWRYLEQKCKKIYQRGE